MYGKNRIRTYQIIMTDRVITVECTTYELTQHIMEAAKTGKFLRFQEVKKGRKVAK